MTINESRLKNGTLSLGPTATALEVSCQITNCRINTSYSDDGDPLTTLCGDTKGAPRKLDGYKLAGTLVQDFDLPEAEGGVIDYVWNHSLELVEFTFTPDDVASGPTVTGSVTLEIPGETYGGDVGSRLTSDFEWSIDGVPVRTYGGAAVASASV